MTDAIRLENLTKDFEVYDRRSDVALELLTGRRRHRTFRALENVSISIPHGEVLGIIGQNGAGKSTLLRIVTGVLDATSGSVTIEGRVTAILELGLGFNGELPGRDNVYLSGLLYGMTRSEIERKFASIVEFSGLKDFIEQPVKTYSSGMQARLAFSIATAVDPEILIIDEALAAGDSMFVQKCMRRIHELCKGGHTVLLVSHGTSLLAQLCTRVVWLEAGRVKAIGNPMLVIQAYDLAAHAAADQTARIELLPEPAPSDASAAQAFQPQRPDRIVSAESLGRSVLRRGPVLIDSVELLDHNRQATTILTSLRPFTLRISYHCDGPLPDQTLGVAIAVNQFGDLAPIMQWFTHNIRPTESRETYATAEFRKPPFRRGLIELDFANTAFRSGTYVLSVGLLPNVPGSWWFWEYRHFHLQFIVDDGGLGIGAFTYIEPHFLHVDLADDAASAPKAQLPPPTLSAEVREICFAKGNYPEGWPRHARCPACDSAMLREAFAKDGFSHRQCTSCDFVCMDPYPADDTIKELYAGRYYTNSRELFEAPRLRLAGTATPYSAPMAELESIIDRTARSGDSGDWLDVGGGIGAFAALIARKRPNWTVTLNEFNPRSIEIAQSQFHIAATTDDAVQLAGQGKSYDVISFIAVVEHIPLPKAVIEQYARLLNPGGSLAIVVPNFTRLSAAVAHAASSSVCPPFHVSLFSRNNLKSMLKSIGFFDSVEISESGPAAFSLIQHVPFADYFDITMPTLSEPAARTIMRRPYESDVARRIAALSEADSKLGGFFADTDGRVFLTAICRKAS